MIISEYGPDLSRFPSEEQFVSHATLAPRVPKSGGKPVKKEKAEQRQHTCRNRFACGGAIVATQRHRSRGVLSEHGAKKRAGHCNICRSQKNSHSNLSPAPLGTTVHRRRSRDVRKAISTAAHQRPGIPRQTTRLSIDSANRIIDVPSGMSHRPACPWRWSSLTHRS